MVDYCLCVGHFVGSYCDCHMVFIVLLLIVVLSISLYYLSAYFLQLFHLVEDEILFGEYNFCTWKFVVCYYGTVSFSILFVYFMLQFDRRVGDELFGE